MSTTTNEPARVASVNRQRSAGAGVGGSRLAAVRLPTFNDFSSLGGYSLAQRRPGAGHSMMTSSSSSALAPGHQFNRRRQAPSGAASIYPELGRQTFHDLAETPPTHLHVLHRCVSTAPRTPRSGMNGVEEYT
jgi:hypothetical protein